MFRILVLVGALAAGGVAAWLSSGLQAGSVPAATVTAQVAKSETQEVLVAAADLPLGTALTGQQVRWQEWPEDSINPSFMTRSTRPDAVDDLNGSVVRQAMFFGEPIHDAKLAVKGAGYLAAVLKPGMRAVAVQVSVESSAGGFILPNNHVDVLHTGGQDGGRSLTLLTNIRVLAIDQNTGESGADSTIGTDSTIGKTATLELSPAQAEVISGAQVNGALSLALRATADNEEEGLAFARRGPGITVRIVRSGQSQIVQTDGAVK